MPSRAYTSFLQRIWNNPDAPVERVNALSSLYLISTAIIATRNEPLESLCQCPLELIPHFYEDRAFGLIQKLDVMCQCPLELIPHFYRYPFKNLGFMRLPEPVFAGIYQNILTTAVFRAC